MPILVNSEGLAEDLPQQQADEALQSGTHFIPLLDKEGNPTSAKSVEDAQNFLSQGYSQPDDSHLNGMLDYSKYSTPLEQAKTFGEGAISGGTLGLGTGILNVLGDTPEAQSKRREINPGVHGLGEATGLIGSSFLLPGGGSAGIMERAGASAAKASGLGGLEAGIASKVGSAAIKGAVENAIFSGGDQVSKLFSEGPDKVSQTAISDLGLNALIGGAIGGAFGAVSPLWKVTQESKLGKLLGAIQKKANGVPEEAIPNTINTMADAAGIKLTPDVSAGISNDPGSRELLQHLQESETSAGKQSQSNLRDLYQGAHDQTLEALGKSPEDIEQLDHRSINEQGVSLRDSIKNTIKSTNDNLAQKFSDIKEKFEGTPIFAMENDVLADELSQFQQKEGYSIIEGNPQGKIINNLVESLPNINTLEDLRKSQIRIGDLTNNPESWSLGKSLRKILRNSEENIIENRLSEQFPDLLGTHREARAAYGQLMDKVEDLNDRLHVGNYAGPESFMKSLDEMNPEIILSRLTPKNDANSLSFMANNFPESAEIMKQNYLDQALQAGSKKVQAGQYINPGNILKQLSGWSPELKSFVLPEAAQSKLEAIKGILDAVPTSKNPPHTAKTLDSLWSKMSGSAMGMIAALTGHNPAMGYVIGSLGRFVGREVPDAVKLATLKFMGSNQPISGEAFKTAVDYISSAAKGEKMAANGVKSVFKAASQVLPEYAEPKPKDLDKLKNSVIEYANGQNFNNLINAGGSIGHYLPEHAISMGALSSRALGYLNSIRPSSTKIGILDDEMKPSKIDQEKYDRAVSIAQQPLMPLKYIAEGTLTPNDVIALKTMYPDVYSSLSQKITNNLIDITSKGDKIPYSKRLSLSMFLGQPLDSTMTPQAIQSIQATMMMPQAQQPKMMSQKHSNAISKLPGLYATGPQSRAMNKSNM